VLTLPAARLPALRPWFTPERPGPLVFAHVAATGVGRCRVDRWPHPRVVLAELPGGNVAVRGNPDAVAAEALADLAGFVEAPPDWARALRRLDPDTAVWERVIAVLPDDAVVPRPAVDVRRVAAEDVAGLTALSPDLTWICATWGGPARVAAAGVGWAAFVGDRPVSVALPFYVGEHHEDIGVVTERDHRRRGLSTACAARSSRTSARAGGGRPGPPRRTTSPAGRSRRGWASPRSALTCSTRSGS
jgi:hypothetical protein